MRHYSCGMANRSAPQPLSAIEVGIDEFLLLMRLAGVEEISVPVLAVHPNVYHPVDQNAVDLVAMRRLLAAELCDASTGVIAPAVARWMRILQAPTAQVEMRVFDGDEVLRAAIVRRGDEHLAVLRHDTVIVVQELHSDDEIESTVCSPLWAALGACEPAAIAPVTVGAEDVADLVAEFVPTAEEGIGDLRRFRARLREWEADADAIEVLAEAALYRGRRTEITYTGADRRTGLQRTADWAVGVMDTSRGRVVSSSRRASDGVDVLFVAGTRSRFDEALVSLIGQGGVRGWFEDAD